MTVVDLSLGDWAGRGEGQVRVYRFEEEGGGLSPLDLNRLLVL